MNIVFIAGVGEKIREWFAGWFGAVLSIIPKTFYFLCTLVFQVMDILQLLVRKVAGLDVVYYTTNIVGDSSTSVTAKSGDIVFEFLRTIFLGENSILSNIFWALIILGVIMLIITTFVAVLRSEYAATDAKSASKGRIIGKAFKAIGSFAIVPIVCFFGVYMANIILQALDTITSGAAASEMSYTYETGQGEGTQTNSIHNLFESNKTANGQTSYISYNFWGADSKNNIPTTSTPISGLIFKASAYNANRIRNYSIFRANLTNTNVSAGVFDKFGTNYDAAANLLDQCFANSYTLKNSVALTAEPFNSDYLFPFGNPNSFISNATTTVKAFDKNNVNLVWYYYDLWSFNFIICIAALIICAKLLIYLVFGLMKRIFEVVVLFLIAAPISSLMPLDDGAALKKWREKFTGKVLGAYGPIVGLNLFFVILPFINSIKFFNIAFIDAIINMFFVIVGLIMVKDLVGTISELIGGENAMKAGQDMAGEVGQSVAKVGKLAAAPVGAAVKGAKFAIKVGKGANNMRKNRAAENEAAMNELAESDPVTHQLVQSGELSKRKVLKNMRNNMSEEQKQNARDAYDQRRASEKLAYYESEKERKADAKENRHLKRVEKGNLFAKLNDKKKAKKTSRRALALSAMQQNGIDPETWKNMSSEQQNNLMQNIKNNQDNYVNNKERYENLISEKEENEASYNDSIDNAERVRAEYSSLESKRDAGVLYGRPMIKGKKWKKANATQKAQSDAKYNDKIKTLKEEEEEYRKSADLYQTKMMKQDEEIQQLQNDIQSAESYTNNKNLVVQTEGIIKSAGKGGTFDEEQAKKAGLAMLNAFKSGLVDSLTPIFDTLGDTLAKGFKDAGGWSEIGQRMLGHSSKETKAGEELKNQKRIIAAQDKASNLLGRGGGGPSTVKLDDASISKLAAEITRNIKK